jgi:uncharacterized membrane protein
MSKSRMESFSDGVIAVAITLLVLNIAVPQPGRYTGTLAHELAKQWPSYAAYVTSFITIGIIWINHHAALSRLRQPDHTILILNLLLLMWIGVLPFATDLFATYLRESSGQKLAATVYAGAFLGMGLSFATLNHHLLFRKSDLLDPELTREERRRIFARSASGVTPYAVATATTWLSPYIALIICGGVAAFYSLPIASGTQTTT